MSGQRAASCQAAGVGGWLVYTVALPRIGDPPAKQDGGWAPTEAEARAAVVAWVERGVQPPGVPRFLGDAREAVQRGYASASEADRRTVARLDVLERGDGEHSEEFEDAWGRVWSPVFDALDAVLRPPGREPLCSGEVWDHLWAYARNIARGVPAWSA